MARNYCLTAFSLEEAYELTKYDKMKYLIIGQEKCPDTGKTHYQGYIELKSVQRISALKKIAPTTHFEKRRGTQKQAADYCKKDNDYIEYGEFEGQGKRNDIERTREILKTTGKMEDVVEQVNSYQAARFGEMYLRYKERKRDWKPHVTWIWGQTGAGKTRKAHEICPNAYVKSDSTKWFYDYDAHEEVIIDDFSDEMMPLTDFLTLIDRYEKRVELKGGSRQFLAKKIVITSEFAPQEYYRHSRGNASAQIMRRLDEVIYMGNGKTEKQEIDISDELGFLDK